MSYESPPPSRHRVPGWLGRNRLGVAVGAAALLVLAAGGVYLGNGTAQPEPSNAANALEYPSPPAGQPVSPGVAVSTSATPLAATTPSTGATPSTAAAPKAPTTGWIPVDRAAWKAQADAYRALTVDPVPAGVGNLPEFRADCQYSHRLPDDPIVSPGLPGASHMHSFVGNKAVDANTAAGDLTKFTATTCKPVQDHSAYWVPTLYDNATGKPVETTGFRVYYRSLAKQLDRPDADAQRPAHDRRRRQEEEADPARRDRASSTAPSTARVTSTASPAAPTATGPSAAATRRCTS